MNWIEWLHLCGLRRPSDVDVKIINPLVGKPLCYRIGAPADSVGVCSGIDDTITEGPYDTIYPTRNGQSIAYGNFLDQRDSYNGNTNTGDYGPYLPQTGTAKDYGEGVIDPRGPGWSKNLRQQFEMRTRQGFEYIELDNPDAYDVKDVIGAIELAGTYGLKVIAKNPLLLESTYTAHPNVYGAIVEKGNVATPEKMELLRWAAGKSNLPVWFVAFESGDKWAHRCADLINQKGYKNMGVTYSPHGEYVEVEHILRPCA